MMPAPDYGFYAEEYKGSSPEEVFSELLPRAVAQAALLVGFNRSRAEHEVPLKRAVCAAVDSYAETGTAQMASLSIGEFSVTRGGVAQDGALKSPDEAARDAAAAELLATGLLFAGARR